VVGIRPGQWNSACLAVIVLKINELTTPALAITEQLKLRLVERVKRVCNREVPLQLVHIGCSYTRILSVARNADMRSKRICEAMPHFQLRHPKYYQFFRVLKFYPERVTLHNSYS